jgi:hypothetical protein
MTLFTGFSVIVLVEACYFFTVRLHEDRQNPLLNPDKLQKAWEAADPTLRRSNSDPDLG